MKKNNFVRFQAVGIFFTLIAFLILGRTLRLQSSSDAQSLLENIKRQNEKVTLRAENERANIYDRWGFLLAGNKEVFDLEVDIKSMVYPDKLASTVATTLGLDYVQLYTQLMVDSGRADPHTKQPYPEKKPALAVSTRIAQGVDAEKIEILDRLEKQYIEEGRNYLSGLVWFPRMVRSYPEGPLAGYVLGMTTFLDPDNPTGFYGVEGRFNEYLNGSFKQVSFERDPIKLSNIDRGSKGTDLILTIDRELQAAVERILEKHMKANGSATGTVVVMDPTNGEILAMASSPAFNPAEYYKDAEKLVSGVPFNPAISKVYEPGSVFKVLTMAAALDSNTVTRQTTFNDTGVFSYRGINVVNWNRGAWGEQTMTGCLANSLNVCLAWISTSMGATTFYEYMDRFSISENTYIDLEGEVTYPLTLPGETGWHETNLATNSYGHSVAVTVVQMLKAVSAVANNGQMVSPHVLKAYVDNGRQYNIYTNVEAPPIKPETARVLSEMLADAVSEEAKTAKVPGYRLAGKTGTADIPIGGSYSSGLTNASFVGWGPVDDPKVMIYVWFEKPRSNIYGSIVAAPVFKEVFQAAATLYNIPPDQVRNALSGK